MFAVMLILIAFFVIVGVYSAVIAMKHAEAGRADLATAYYMVGICCLMCLVGFIILV